MKYINEFIKYKESKGEKAIYRVNDNCGNTYYGEDYVHWLEEQLRIHDVVRSACQHHYVQTGLVGELYCFKCDSYF